MAMAATESDVVMEGVGRLVIERDGPRLVALAHYAEGLHRHVEIGEECRGDLTAAASGRLQEAEHRGVAPFGKVRAGRNAEHRGELLVAHDVGHGLRDGDRWDADHRVGVDQPFAHRPLEERRQVAAACLGRGGRVGRSVLPEELVHLRAGDVLDLAAVAVLGKPVVEVVDDAAVEAQGELGAAS